MTCLTCGAGGGVRKGGARCALSRSPGRGRSAGGGGMFGLGPARIRRLSARVLPADQKACSGRPRQIILSMTQLPVFASPSVTLTPLAEPGASKTAQLSSKRTVTSLSAAQGRTTSRKW
ncbi:hypothetical protein E2C01_095100 [Portunus trituberculatus]|uniref:Uncharacterized protein n=1 Tax=Portunus trituberculatus TaxID=210409 RepID=A0A5B7JUF8_PORTR|nr:hypothetical protein [Portunus trituberculatus]